MLEPKEPRLTLEENGEWRPGEVIMVPLDAQCNRYYINRGIDGGQIRSFRYQYTAPNGMVFETGAIDLDHARRLRDDWLAKHTIKK